MEDADFQQASDKGRIMSFARAIALMQSRISALGRNTDGSMLPLAAAGLIVLMGLVGGGVDISRVYKVQNRLQAACDAGVLAGRKAVTTNGFDSTASTQATTYFNVNFDRAQQAVSTSPAPTFTPTSPDSGNTVVATASATVPMVVMRMFGKTSIPVTTTCKATQGISNIDVTFVLDVTGSMDSTLGSTTRIQALKDAANSFYDTIATSTGSTSARVRYAFVPFSENVNVGGLLRSLDSSYLLNTYTVQSRVARFDTAINEVFASSSRYSYPKENWAYESSGFNTTPAQHGSTNYANLPACQAAKPADETTWTNSGSPQTTTSNNFNVNNGAYSVTRTRIAQAQTQSYYFCNRSGDDYLIYKYTATRYYNQYTYGTLTPTSVDTSQTVTFDHWDYRPVTYDMTAYKSGSAVTTNTDTDGAAISSTWAGCIEERYTVSDGTFAYDSGSQRITPTAAIDLDIDTAPTSDANRWAPQWPDVAFYRTSGRSMSNSLLTNSGSQAGSECPPAARTLASMTQSEFNTYINALSAQGNTYHDIGMLWGARISSPNGLWSSLVNLEPSNHQTVARHLILETDGEPASAYSHATTYGIEYHDRRITDDSSTDEDARHIARFRALCDAVKAKGIRVWVIALATSLSSDLTYCASTNSSYTATDSAQLDTAFQNIAKQIGELRISQ